MCSRVYIITTKLHDFDGNSDTAVFNEIHSYLIIIQHYCKAWEKSANLVSTSVESEPILLVLVLFDLIYSATSALYKDMCFKATCKCF